MAPVNGTKHLQSLNISQLSQSEAVNELKSLASTNGSSRLRENSKTFTKAEKRTAFRLAMNEFKRKICGNSQELNSLWESHSTGKGQHDMTGDELNSLMAVMEQAIQNSGTSPSRAAAPSFSFNGTPQTQNSVPSMSMRPSVAFDGRQVQVQDGRTRSATPVHGFDNIPGPPKLDPSDEVYVTQIVEKHEARLAQPKQPYARNHTDEFAQGLKANQANEDIITQSILADMANE